MKKVIGLLLPLVLLCGCGKTKLEFNTNETTRMIYDNMEIISSDYESVLNELNNIEFKETKDVFQENNLTIITKDTLYNFNLEDDRITYSKDNKNYISNDVTDLLSVLGSIKANYNNFNFYTIAHRTSFELEEDALLIDLGSENEYYIITTNEDLLNFRINALESVDGELKEINLLYQNNKISDRVIAIRTTRENTPNLKISFTTKYNYLVTIIPTYYEENKEMNFVTTYEQR